MNYGERTLEGVREGNSAGVKQASGLSQAGPGERE